MAGLSQTEQGKAFEYIVACSISTITKAPLIENKAMKIAMLAYSKLSNESKYWLDLAASKSSSFLCNYDNRLNKAISIAI